MSSIHISLVYADARQVQADTIALKYAQALHGLDRRIAARLLVLDKIISGKLPAIGDHYFLDSHDVTDTKHILFVGTPPLIEFNYSEIRSFGKNILSALATANPQAQTVLMTIHGPGYGLDETEAFESQLAGLMDGIADGHYPMGLREIIFAENSERRVQRLQVVLDQLLPDRTVDTSSRTEKSLNTTAAGTAELLSSVGHNSASKKRVFVAMPFAPEFDDHFHYGIQGAVKDCGYLCERADLASFTGNVMDWVKTRIAGADFVIADLTTANPNVYLEIGYAWGLGKRTVLLIRDTQELKFDTQGQRCLVYTSIKDMEAKLKNELSALSI